MGEREVIGAALLDRQGRLTVPPKMRRATPAQIARSLQELSILWAKPRPPDDPGNETAPVATEAAEFKSRETPKQYANRTRRARGAK